MPRIFAVTSSMSSVFGNEVNVRPTVSECVECKACSGANAMQSEILNSATTQKMKDETDGIAL